jgi:hypothetical protein
MSNIFTTNQVLYNIQNLTINVNNTTVLDSLNNKSVTTLDDIETPQIDEKVKKSSAPEIKPIEKSSSLCWKTLGKVTAVFALIISAVAGATLAMYATVSDMTKVELGIAIGVLGHKISKNFMEAEINCGSDYFKTWYDSYESILTLSLQIFPVITLSHALFTVEGIK